MSVSTITSSLLDPYFGSTLDLPNRIAMAPMTRGRADDLTGVPHPFTPTYYASRSSAALIVTEGIYPAKDGKAGPGVPGLVSNAHAQAWRDVTSAVHAAGGRIYAQLWHGGRVSHPLTIGESGLPLAPSAVRTSGPVYTAGGWVESVVPVAMTLGQIALTIDQFVTAARRAIEAGFDGVELHGANGYLIQQFLADNTNQRTDRYGGSETRRIRLAVEVVEAVSAEVGADRVGIRLSPGNPENDILELDPASTYRALIRQIDELGLAYLHLVETQRDLALGYLRPLWSSTLIANDHTSTLPTTLADGERLIESGADVVAFGRAWLANPDLPERFAHGLPLRFIPHEQYYGAGAQGFSEFETSTQDHGAGSEPVDDRTGEFRTDHKTPSHQETR